MKLLEMSGHNFNAPQAGELLDILNRDCNPWISASKWLPVYRGSKMISQYDDFIKIKVRPEKQDPDIPTDIQKTVDRALKRNGHTALICNSIHVTGNVNIAQEYGRLFVIFPISEFSFSWSPKVYDLMAVLRHKDEKIRKLSNVLPSYSSENLQKAIVSGNEILVNCKEYYKVDFDLWNTISA